MGNDVVGGTSLHKRRPPGVDEVRRFARVAYHVLPWRVHTLGITLWKPALYPRNQAVEELGATRV